MPGSAVAVMSPSAPAVPSTVPAPVPAGTPAFDALCRVLRLVIVGMEDFNAQVVPAFCVLLDEFHVHLVADVHRVRHLFDAVERQLCNVDQAVLAGEKFH